MIRGRGAGRPNRKPRSAISRLFLRLAKEPVAMLGVALIMGVLVCAVFAPQLAPHSYSQQTIRSRLQPPMWSSRGDSAFPLGRDSLGRDLLSRMIYGSRISLFVGLASVLVGVVLGVPLGLCAGYFGGWVDNLISRLVDIQMSIPEIVLVLAVMTVLGPGLWKVIAVLGTVSWLVYARLARAEAIRLREAAFVSAARALGCSHTRILLRHMLPNVLSPVVAVGALDIGRKVISSATLSFLGLGVPPPYPELGAMVADGRDFLASAWWVATFPGIVITVIVLGFSLTGDFLRDCLDPRMRRS